MHLRASFNNGVTRDELKELIMHSALYCGLPAANATMHLAQQVFERHRRRAGLSRRPGRIKAAAVAL